MKKNKYKDYVIIGAMFAAVILLSVGISFLFLRFGKESSSEMQQIGISIGLSENFISELAILDEKINKISDDDDKKNEKVESLKAEIEISF